MLSRGRNSVLGEGFWGTIVWSIKTSVKSQVNQKLNLK
jgi:hypothetical protein